MLLKPKIKLKRITDISISILKKYDIDTLILDVDNTMSTHHGQVLTDGLSDWIDMMHKNNIAIYFVQRERAASTVRALFLERKVSAPPEIAPLIPARRPCCKRTTAIIKSETTITIIPKIISIGLTCFTSIK